MHRFRVLAVTAAALTMLGVFAAAPAASAAPTLDQAQPEAALPPLDPGYFYAWQDADYTLWWCAWFNNDRDWGFCDEKGYGSTTMLNRASSVANNGYPVALDKVRLYYNKPNENGGRSAWACIGQGDEWHWLGDRYFNLGATGSGTGHGLSTNDNIAGHAWADTCS